MRANLLGGPERRLGLFVHAPDIVVLDGEDDKAAGVVLQQRLHLPAPVLLRLFELENKRKSLTVAISFMQQHGG